MRSTEVQTLGNCACVTPLIDGLVQEQAYIRCLHASSSRRVRHGLASYGSRQHAGVNTLWLLEPARYAERARYHSFVFTAYLSNAVVSGKSPFPISVSRCSKAADIANRSPRIVVPDTQTHRQTTYCNPRCACTPRVDYYSPEKASKRWLTKDGGNNRWKRQYINCDWRTVSKSFQKYATHK